MNYAVIKNNEVINVIVADSKEIAEEVTGLTCLDVTDGWDYNNGIDGKEFFPVLIIEEPVIEEPVIENPTE